MSTLIVKRDELEKAIEKTIRTAAEWFRSMGGETQLYGIHDGKAIYDFDIVNFAGCSSWCEGKYIIPLFRQKWFFPIEHWDWNEELKNQLEGDSVVRAEFQAACAAADEEYSYDYCTFQRLLPERAKDILEEWRQIALDEYVLDGVRVAVDHILENEELMEKEGEWHV